MHGARISLLIGFASTAIAVLIGSSIGILAGWYGGRVDAFVMQVMDILLAFPSLILGMIVVAMLGSSLTNIILAIALTSIAPFARIARAPTIAIKARDFIEACRSFGFSTPRILVVHVLPNIMAEILVMGALWLANAIRTEASLAFIGLGLKPPIPTWGGMIREGFDNILDNAWLALVPGLCGAGRHLRLEPDRRRSARRHRSQAQGRHMSRASAPLLVVSGLTTSFRTGGAWRAAVNDLSFHADANETLAIVGESGSGKSVTALSLMGLVPPANGRVEGRHHARAAAICWRCPRPRCAGAWQRDRHDLSGADDEPQSGDDGRQPDRRGLRYHRGLDRRSAGMPRRCACSIACAYPTRAAGFEDYPISSPGACASAS